SCVVDPPQGAGAVVVEVARRQSSTHLQPLECGCCPGADVDELPAPLVSEQELRLLEWIWIAALHLACEVSHCSVYDNEIEPAVVVDVDETRAKACDPKLEHTPLHRPVLEETLAGVEVHRVRLVVEIGGEQIL